MIFKTKYHGELEYNEDEIIIFPKGIPGFSELSKFIVKPIEGNEEFSLLHSLESQATGFIVVSPFLIEDKYEFMLEEGVIENLKIQNKEEVLVLNTVTLSSEVKDITTNLAAPIIINIKTNLGEQIILNNDKYKIKHPLIKG